MAVGERAGRRAVGEDRQAEAREAPAQRDLRRVAGPAGALALGGSAGNAALCRALTRGTAPGAVLQRGIAGDVMDWVSDRVGDAMDTRPDEACLDAREDLEDFMSRDYSREDFHPSTGRGLFDAHYAPADGALTITVGVTFGFADGNPADPTWVASVGGPAAAAAYTADKFAWTEDEKTQWKETAIGQIQGRWSDRWTFHTQRACWEALPPVNVSVRIVERPAAGADKSHFVTTVTKWPTEPGLTESVTPPGAGADQSTARFQESGAEGITNPDVSHFRRTTRTRARYGQVDTDNPGRILFALGKAEVSAADRARLTTFGATLGAPDIPPFPVTVSGRASSEGTEEDNMALSETRARNVADVIRSAGAKREPVVVPLGEAGAAPTADWRRAEITVGAFESEQTTILHEAGHMLGLGDEYPTADPTPGNPSARAVGTPVAHSGLAQRLIPGQQPIVAHHDESIMSNGELIRPHHYVTFLEVLGAITGTEGEWDLKPGRAAGQGPGDFPVPAPDAPVAV